jgi:nicotinic acid mononucleotide adenylyltransferase
MKELCDELNASPWKGAISEAGIGLDFSYQFLSHPGASKTILDIHSPYGSFEFDGRKVSLEAAQALASKAFSKAARVGHSRGTKEVDTSNLFGFAMTGAHYEDKPTHAWACLKTKDFEAYIHYSMETIPDRETAGWVSSLVLSWFLSGCLFPKTTWLNWIGTHPKNHGIQIDVLYAPGIGDVERLSLLGKKSALVYHSGKFQRVVDYVRDYDIIFSGSFNPPHAAHLKIGEGALLELSVSNHTKGFASSEDIVHRLKMLDLFDMPVLITQEPLFLEKDKIFKSYVDKVYTYRMGSDAWNLFVDHLPQSSAANRMSFEVYPRAGYERTPTNDIDVRVLHEVMDISSTEIRERKNYSGLDNKVQQYIENHGLYKS